jgi:hypothetical protein
MASLFHLSVHSQWANWKENYETQRMTRFFRDSFLSFNVRRVVVRISFIFLV